MDPHPQEQEGPHPIPPQDRTVSESGGSPSTCVMMLPTESPLHTYDIYDGLPHPRHRHGFPCTYLVVSPATGTASDRHTLASSPYLCEVQLQQPPEGFGQTWFIGKRRVHPQNTVPVATRVDPTFIFLRKLWDGGDEENTMFRTATAMLELPSVLPAAGHQGSSPGAATTVFNMEDDDDDDDDDVEDALLNRFRRASRAARGDGGPPPTKQARSEACCTTHPPQQTDGRQSWWQHWWAAAAPGTSLHRLLYECAPRCLSRICDVKRGGDADSCYYRFSSAKAALWLQGRVERVQRSPALMAFLQLDAANESDSSKRARHTPALYATARELVAEYVLDAMALVLLPPVPSSSPSTPVPDATPGPTCGASSSSGGAGPRKLAVPSPSSSSSSSNKTTRLAGATNGAVPAPIRRTPVTTAAPNNRTLDDFFLSPRTNRS